MRIASIALLVTLGGCCFLPEPAPVAVGTPPVTTPPIPPPTVPPVPGSSMETCVALCEHAGHCLDTRGVPRTAETADCATACTTGHTYGSLPAQAYACLNQPTCSIFESCLEAAMGAALAGGMGAPTLPPGTVPPGTMPPGTVPPGGPPTAAGAPPGWPEGFPVVPGGVPVEAPPGGPVRVALLMYSDTSGADLDARYHEALAAAGWTATPSEPGPEARRFTATRGAATVSVSVLESPGLAMIQTMQF